LLVKRIQHESITFWHGNLFLTDIESSTQLWEKFPQAMKVALANHDSILKQAIGSNHGQIIQSTGDGFPHCHLLLRITIDTRSPRRPELRML